MRKWRNRQLQHILFRLITLAVIGYFSPNVFAQSSTSVEIGLDEKRLFTYCVFLMRISTLMLMGALTRKYGPA